jgi:hypothetical protein
MPDMPELRLIVGRVLVKMTCIGCGKHPDELAEYIEAAADEPEYYADAIDFCYREEGTLNKENGHFLCTDCYFIAGAPAAPGGWKAP